MHYYIVCLCISVTVSNFYRECNFIRGSISRLEAVMKTDIKSQIAKFHHAKLAELNPNTMRDGRIINAEISPLQFVEEVVFTRNINSSSTWQDFFEVLHEAGLQKLSEKIESFMKGIFFIEVGSGMYPIYPNAG